MKKASLFVVAVLAAFAVFHPALDLEYWSDDLDHLQAIGILRAGKVSFLWWLFQNHNEHVVPVLRLFFLTITGRSGFNAHTAYALSIVLWGLCAGLTGMLAYRSTGSYARGCSAALLFAAMGTTATMSVTVLTSTMFPQALAFYLLALLIRNPWGKIVCCVLAGVCFPGSFPFGVAVALDSWPRFGWRAVAAFAGVSVFVLAMNLAAHRFVGATPKAIDLRGVPFGLWMPFTTPFRMIWSLHGTVDPPIKMMAAVSAALWVIIIWLGRGMGDSRTRWLILVLLAGGLCQTLVTGGGRGMEMSLRDLYYTDRYYTYFLTPAALFIACAPLRSWMLIAVAAAALLGSSLEFRRMRRDAFQGRPLDHFDKANRLSWMIADEVRLNPGKPLILEDDFLPMPGMNKGGLRLSTVFYICYPNGLHGVVFAQRPDPGTATAAGRPDDTVARRCKAAGSTAERVARIKNYQLGSERFRQRRQEFGIDVRVAAEIAAAGFADPIPA